MSQPDKFRGPPNSPPRFALWGEDSEWARDVLLHFVHDAGHDEAFAAYLETHYEQDECERWVRRKPEGDA